LVRNKLTLALLKIGDRETKSGATWLKRTFGKIAPSSHKDAEDKLNSAISVVVTQVVLEACDSVGINTLNAQLDAIPANFHVVSMFGMCLVISIAFLLRKEGSEIDVKSTSVGIVGALLVIRNEKDKIEQYQLAHILLQKFTNAGGKATEWQNNLTDIVCMYLLSVNDPTLRKHDYPSLFGSMLKTILSAFEPSC